MSRGLPRKQKGEEVGQAGSLHAWRQDCEYFSRKHKRFRVRFHQVLFQFLLKWLHSFQLSLLTQWIKLTYVLISKQSSIPRRKPTWHSAEFILLFHLGYLHISICHLCLQLTFVGLYSSPSGLLWFCEFKVLWFLIFWHILIAWGLSSSISVSLRTQDFVWNFYTVSVLSFLLPTLGLVTTPITSTPSPHSLPPQNQVSAFQP